MKYSIRILLIESVEENVSSLFQLLIKNDYEVSSLSQVEQVIKKILNKHVDLIISKNLVDGDNGFRIYKRLKPYLLKAGIPFLLNLETFNKDDVLIGLEMGIDNFIILPMDETLVKFKIENELKKKTELDVFETRNFTDYFDLSSVAMFFTTNNKIEKVNSSFCNLNNIKENMILQKPVNEVFDFSGNEQNELNYRKFRSGAADSCKLHRVTCCQNLKNSFNVNVFRGNNMGTSADFGEMMVCDDIQNELKANDEILSKNVIQNDFPDDKNRFQLTEREKVIFKLSSQGLAIKQIASKLNLSQRTVEKHRANIMHKTQTNNFIETISKVHQYADGEID